MTCDKAAQIHAYHDGELLPAQRAAIEAHLRTCVDCAALLADLRRVSALVANAPMERISPIALARLERSFYAARDRGVLRVASWLTAAAAAVLLFTMLMIPSEQPGGDATVSAAAWQTIAVMPPADEADEPVPELVLAAQWMANDLASFDTAAAGERP
jgi:anti-sigma factor RsiW